MLSIYVQKYTTNCQTFLKMSPTQSRIILIKAVQTSLVLFYKTHPKPVLFFTGFPLFQGVSYPGFIRRPWEVNPWGWTD